MDSENLNMTEITEARRKAIAASIRPVTVEELHRLESDLFPYADDPWRERYQEFIKQHPSASYYHATTHDQVHLIYCDTENRGIWFVPGSGLGPLQEKGLKIMKEVVKKGH
jgi:hypothetical protein